MDLKKECIGIEIDLINDYLNKALDNDLLLEVVVSALRELKEDPNLHISQAMARGFYEWVK
jgi:hypothetical protein